MPTRTNMETGEPIVDEDDEVPTGDEIAEEIEEYLKDQDEEGEG